MENVKSNECPEIDHKRARDIIGIIDLLPRDERISLLFFYYSKITITEIAELMEKDRKQIMYYLISGKEKVRRGIWQDRRLRLEYREMPLVLLIAEAYLEDARLCVVPEYAQRVLEQVMKAIRLPREQKRRSLMMGAIPSIRLTDEILIRIMRDIS